MCKGRDVGLGVRASKARHIVITYTRMKQNTWKHRHWGSSRGSFTALLPKLEMDGYGGEGEGYGDWPKAATFDEAAPEKATAASTPLEGYGGGALLEDSSG